MKFYRILYCLINNSYKKISQRDISKYSSCTPAYVCKVIKRLIQKKIVVKINKNRIIVQNPLMLAYLLSYSRRFPHPLMFRTTNYKDALAVLKKTTYSITLDSAGKKKPEKIWAYVLGKDVNYIIDSFNQVWTHPDLIIFPADIFRFRKQKIVNNVYTVSDWDLVIDYLTVGNNYMAVNLLKKYKLCEL